MILESLVCYPVYDIPEQIRRRVGFAGTTSSLDSLIDVVARGGKSAIGSVEYQSALSGIVGFDETAAGVERPLINVGESDKKVVEFSYNSADTGVYNFIATIVANPINETRSQETRYIVTGYTSQATRSLTGLLPDDMVLNINDIYGLRVTYAYGSLGERKAVGFRMMDNYVLSQALNAEGYMPESTIDLISVAKSADMVNKMNLSGNEKFIPTGDTLFAPNTQTTAQLMSNKLTRPDNFVTAISNSYLKTLGNDDTLTQVDSFFEGSGAYGIQRELTQLGVMRQFNNYDFVQAMRSALQRNTGQNEGNWRNSNKAQFRLMDLRHAIDNTYKLDEDIRTSLREADRVRFALEADKTDAWLTPKGNATQGSLVQYDMAMQLAPIMVKSLVGEMSFTFDNRSADFMTPAQLQIDPMSVGGVAGAQMPPELASQLIGDLNALMLTVTKHNAIRCSVWCIAKLGVVNRIEIQIDGEIFPESRTFASFLSSRLHMGNTTDLSYVGQLASDVNTLTKAIDEGYNDHERTIGKGRILSNIPTGPSGGSLLADSGLTSLGGGSDSFNF